MNKYVVFVEPEAGSCGDPLSVRVGNSGVGYSFYDYTKAKSHAESLVRTGRTKVGIYEVKVEFELPVTMITPEDGESND